jgi:hypothetical protein
VSVPARTVGVCGCLHSLVLRASPLPPLMGAQVEYSRDSNMFDSYESSAPQHFHYKLTGDACAEGHGGLLMHVAESLCSSQQ